MACALRRYGVTDSGKSFEKSQLGIQILLIFLVPRYLPSVDLVCQKMVELVDWNEKFLTRT
jgi:hypothetical protein